MTNKYVLTISTELHHTEIESFILLLTNVFVHICHALIIRSKFLQGKDNILHLAIPTVIHAVLFNVHTCKCAQ